MSVPQPKFMQRAVQLAIDGVRSGNGGPFGCVIVKGDEIVGEGNNRVTSTNDPTAHAEVVAIRDACQRLGTFQLDDCEIYTSCEPCPMCLGAILWARPSAVYFAGTQADAAAAGFDDAEFYRQFEIDPTDRSVPMHNFMRDAANDAFDAWLDLDEKIEY